MVDADAAVALCERPMHACDDEIGEESEAFEANGDSVGRWRLKLKIGFGRYPSLSSPLLSWATCLGPV